MFIVSRGPEEWDSEHHPHHHLVDADHNKLHDISDHPVSQLKVNVNEMDLDAVTITALSFAAIAINFILFAHVDSGLVGGFVASLQNRIASVSRVCPSVLVAMLETRSPRLHVELAQIPECFFCMSQDLSRRP